MRTLLQDGRVTVSPPGHVDAEDRTAVIDDLAEFERQYRLELPGTPPRFEAEIALQAALLFHQACQFLLYRDGDAADMQTALSALPGDDEAPHHHYAVDLTMRFLPGLWQLAASASPDDPLVKVLHQWATKWPLSSVGIPDVQDFTNSGFADHDCLRRLYIDRIIATEDVSRLNEPQIRAGVEAALGPHQDTTPAIRATLQAAAKEQS